jgi:hypothetical protein
MAKKRPSGSRTPATARDISAVLQPALDEALKLGGHLLQALKHEPEGPPEIDPPPDGFRVRAWQTIDDEERTGTLHLDVDGLKAAADWEVEVAFEDADKKVDSKELGKGKVDFELPNLWVEYQGARFVTVYIRKKQEAAEKEKSEKERTPKLKPQEQSSTIIRIIPARLRQSAAEEFDEIEGAAGTDD